jgi:hypothetical protein
MNEEFITKGIENDRYLKAVRLYKQFEEEMFTTLENVSKNVVEAEPDWFVEGVKQSRNIQRHRTDPLGYLRVDNKMARVNETGDRLKFHVCIEWSQPEAYRHDEQTDGALCIVFYKIKNLDQAEYEHVRQQTEQADRWSEIQFDDDLWDNDLGLFYIPVESGPAVKSGFETLTDHFLEFGESYGTPASEEGG